MRRAGGPSFAVRRWASGWLVCALPVVLRAYVVGLPVAALLAAVVLLGQVSVAGRDVLLAGVLLSAGAVSVEATRRIGRPSNTLVKDLLSVWWLPMAVLLPPAYVLLAPVPLLALAQWRVHTTLWHRRVFSAASIGLSYAAVSVGFHAAVPRLPGLLTGELLAWALAVTAAGVVAAAFNAVLVAVAVKASDPTARWAELLGDADRLRTEGVETCLGVMAALLAGLLHPTLLIFMLPPVLLQQRGLLHAQLRAVAMLDVKTGLLNAGAWEREAQAKLLALRRRGQDAAVLLVDLDHFKAVNDQHGHLVGDEVLRAVAGALTGGAREGDLIGRFGGEEFVALLPAADAQEAAVVAERLRSRVAAQVVVLEHGDAARVTASIGVAVSAASKLSLLDLLAGADRCMYQAKARGRDCVQQER